MFPSLSGATWLAPIVGDPIAQVKSPAGVTQRFRARGVDAICVPLHVAPADFGDFLRFARSAQNLLGVIVTLPHKFAAFAGCDQVGERARFVQTVNTIRRRADGSLIGEIFDGEGFVAASRAKGCDYAGARALLLGAGGAGTAIAAAIAAAGVAHLGIADVNAERRDGLVSRLVAAGYPASAAAADATGRHIVVNATPLGMRRQDPAPLPLETLNCAMFVGDVVTMPEIPPLIAAARALGCRVSTGVEMFEKVGDLLVDFLLADEAAP